MATKTLTAVEAGQRAQDSADKADELERRLRSGDQRVTAKQIADARLEAEHAALLAEGAKANEARRAAEDLEVRGEELHAEWVADILGDFENVEKTMVGFQQAAAALIDSLTTYEDRRLGYKSKWSGLFAGNTELAAALRFKAGGRPGGDFGALDDPHSVARHINPVQTLVALLGEVVGPRDTQLTGFDQTLQVFLRQGAYREGLKSLRELRRQLDKEKEIEE